MIRVIPVLALATLVLSANAALAQDPHAGHRMPPAQPADPDPDPDPHAGHDRSPVTDPLAALGGAPPPDPHAGHDMTAMGAGPPDVPTSADTPGRPPEDAIPAAAFSGPAHAADLIFGPDAMAPSRQTLIRENGNIRTTAVIIDRLELSSGDGDDAYLWDVQGWTGGDLNRLWWKTEGEGDFGGDLHEVELQLLYGRALTPFWDVQAGVRHDVRPDGDDTTHLVLGVQGLAPHWWEVDAAVFLSTEGDLTARIEAEYDQRLTQRLILQPRLELAASAGDIPALETGSGLTTVSAGLRLRYEVRKELAPYVGIEWSRALGGTADYITTRGDDPEDTRLVLGLRAWF